MADFDNLNVSGNATIGTLAVGTPPWDNSKVSVVGGPLAVGNWSSADAAIHVHASYGGFDRLLQMRPELPGKPGLNLLASTDNSGGEQWWAWGVDENRWQIQPGATFTYSPALAIAPSGNVGIGTNEPEAALHISRGGPIGDIKLFASAGGGCDFGYDGGNDNAFWFAHYGDVSGYTLFRHQDVANDQNSKSLLVLSNSGNVSIPSGSLSVEGSMSVAGDAAVNGTLRVAVDVAVTGNASLASSREIVFQDNGQIRSQDNNHRILFRRSENKLELREFGQIIFSPGATSGNETAKVVITETGDIHVKGGDVVLDNSDLAEDFDIMEPELVDPGSVMVLDEGGCLRACINAYDKRVAGIVSGAKNLRPGIILGKQHGQANRKPIALTGKVYCKVDAEFASVEVGDLLTTSPTPGHAMKAVDQSKAFGCVIGKAMGGLTAGKGLIPVLVTLQ